MMRNRVDIFGVALGFFATISQVVLMREALGVTGGNELAVSLGFALWFVGVGIGAFLAVPVSRWQESVSMGAVGAPFLVALGLLVLRHHRTLLSLPVGVEPTLSALIAILSFGVGAGGLCVGFLFTVAARNASKGMSAPVSRLYGAEAVGALIGGLVFTFVMAPLTSHLIGIGIAAIILAVAAARWSSRRAVKLVCVAYGGVVFFVVIFGLLGRLSSHTLALAVKAIRTGEIVEIRESPYGRLALIRSEDQYEILVDGRTDYAFPDPWGRARPVHLAMTVHPNPKRVLLVGGGPSDRLEAVLAHGPTKVVLTYLDHDVHEMCENHWPKGVRDAVTHPTVRVVEDDGRRFVFNTDERFDVVLVAAHPPLSAGANRYHSLAFYERVKQILAKGGSMTIVAQGGANVLAPESARSAASSLATVREVFPYVALVPGTDLIVHASASKGSVTTDSALLSNRFRERRVVAEGFSWRRFESIYDNQRIASVHEQLRHIPATINRDSHPSKYLANLQLWERRLSRAGEASLSTITGALERYAWLGLVIPIGVFVIWRFGSRRRRLELHANALFPIATTGAAGMGIEVMILYTYQAAEGTLYTGLAMLVALFMAGLAAGAFLGRRYLNSGRFRDGAIADGVMVLLLGTSAWALTMATANSWIPIFWSPLAGGVTGAAFPAFLGLSTRTKGGDEREAAAGIEAADHLGAAFGALVTGIVWLPVFGIFGTSLLFATLKGASLLGQARIESSS